MKAAHRLVGYDRRTESEKFELVIPERLFGEIRTVIRIDDDDPDAIGCYELTDGEANQIATMVQPRSLPAGLDFFLEAYAS